MAEAFRRSWPAVTSSQRHTIVSSRSHSCQPGRTPCAASMRAANEPKIARLRWASLTSGSRDAPPAAQCPATRPSARERSTPPIPVTSPAA
ncbi:hypothetical protein ACFPRL_24635 [Pseudoclavibacter helvolus]